MRRRPRPGAARALAVGVALALCTAACSATVPEYEEQRERWTQEKEAWEGFVLEASVFATLKTEPFRRAYVKEYSRLFALTEAQRERLLKAELQEASEYHVVIVAFSVRDVMWNDLNPRRGIWEVRLENPVSGRWVPPLSARRLDANNPTWAELYPFASDQHVFWELRFNRAAEDGPVAADGEPLELVIAGAPARIRLRWGTP